PFGSEAVRPRPPPAGIHAGAGVEWGAATRRGPGPRLCLERQDLPKPLRSRFRYHWDPVVRAAFLRPARSDGGAIMSQRPPKRVRCAIYTRVSTEYGLEQDFNSLDAQHDAAAAYVRSQAQEGWTLIRARYDDGGYSGGSTDRPALQRLLADIRARKID